MVSVLFMLVPRPPRPLILFCVVVNVVPVNAPSYAFVLRSRGLNLEVQEQAVRSGTIYQGYTYLLKYLALFQTGVSINCE